MKVYGNGKKATEISRKQINVLYGMAKRGEIKVEKWVMSDFYATADYYGYDDNTSVADDERDIQRMLEFAFAGKIEELQEAIDRYTESTYSRLSRKRREQAVRGEYVA